MSSNDPVLPEKKLTEKDLDYLKFMHEGRAREKRIQFAGIGIAILCSALPLYVIALIVESIAGKTTEFNMKIAIGVSIAFALSSATGGAAWVYRGRKIKEQGEELTRTRTRTEMLETTNNELKQERNRLEKELRGRK